MIGIASAALAGLSLLNQRPTPKPPSIEVPPLATLRSYVPTDMRVRLAKVDPKKDGRLAFGRVKALVPKKDLGYMKFHDLPAVSSSLRTCAAELQAWNPTLDLALAASKLKDWSSGLAGDSELSVDEEVRFGLPTALLKDCALGLVVRSRLYVAKHDPRAADQYVACLRIGTANISGRGPQLDFLIGESLLSIAFRAVQVDTPYLSPTVLRIIALALPEEELVARNFAESQRQQLDLDLRYLRSSVKGALGSPGWADPVLERHPNAFDAKETVEIMAECLRPTLKAAQRPYSQMGDLRPHITTYGDLPEDRPSTPEAMARLRDRMAKIPNVLGRVIGASRDIPEMSKMLLGSFDRLKADLAATRIIVASTLYKFRYGHFPKTLQILVEDGLLKRVPRDPFDGKPFRFDSTRAIVWSASEDGKDNRGHDKPWVFGKKSRDRVWPLDGHKDAR